MPQRLGSGKTPAAVQYVEMTCALDGYAHLISDEAHAVGAGQGTYTALCGHAVLASALAAPTAKLCPSCRQASG